MVPQFPQKLAPAEGAGAFAAPGPEEGRATGGGGADDAAGAGFGFGLPAEDLAADDVVAPPEEDVRYWERFPGP